MRAVPTKLLLAVLAAMLSAGSALAADPPPPPASGTPVIVEEVKTGDTTVIVVERTPKPLRETPEWAYPERGLTFFPDGPGKGNDRWAVGGMWMIAPLFTASYARGLGSGFTVGAEVETIVLFNQLNVGAEWAFRAGPFSFGVTGKVGGYYGALGKALIETTSFDSSGWGVMALPGAKAGLQVAKDSWLTLKYEAYLSLYQAVNLGGMVLSPQSFAYSGFGLSAIVEWSPAKSGVIYYGLSMYNTAANYPMFFNVEATPSSESFNNNLIWYLGVLAGYEF